MTEGADKPHPLIRRTLLKRVLKAIAVGFGLAFLIALGLFVWALDSGFAAKMVRVDLSDELRERCGVEATFDNLTLDALRREVRLFDLVITDREGQRLLAVEQAHVKLRFLPLFYGRYQLARADLLRPEARIVIEGGRVVDLPRCLEPPDTKSATPIALGIADLTVERGRFEVRVDDGFAAELDDINVALTEADSGGKSLAASVDDGRLTLRGRPVPLHRFRFLGHLEGLLVRPRALIVDRLEAAVADVEAELSGSIDLLGPVYDGRVVARGPLSTLPEVWPDAPDAQGRAEIDLRIAGSAVLPRAVGTVVLEGARVAGYGFGDRAEIELSADLTGADLRRIDITLGEGRVLAKGKVGFTPGVPFEVQVRTAQLSLARVLDAVGSPGSWANLFATGEADLVGRLDPLGLDGAFGFDVDDLTVYDRAWAGPEVARRPWAAVPDRYKMLGVKAVRVDGAWHFDEDKVEFRGARFVAGGTSGSCEARVGFAAAAGMKVEARIPNFDWVDVGPVAGVRFGGYGSMSGVVEGPYDDIGGVGIFDLADVSVAEIPFGSGIGNVDWHDDVQLDVTGIEGRLGDSRYTASVGVTLRGETPLNISGRIIDGRVEDMFIPFRLDGREFGDPQGKLRAKFDLFGPVDRLTGPVEVDIEGLTVVDERAESGRIMGRLEQGRLVADAISLRKRGARLQGYGFLDPNRGDLRLRARTRNAHLSDLDVVRTSLPRLEGGLDVELAVDGSLHGVTGTVSAVFADVHAGPYAIGDGRLRGPIAGSVARLAGRVGSIVVEDSEIKLQGGLPYAATLRLEETDVPAIVAGLDGHRDYSGSVTMTAQTSGALVDWARSDGTVFVERGRFSAGGLTLETGAPTRFTMRRGVLTTKRATILGPRTRLVADGAIGAALDLKLSGRVDLALFELVSPTIEKAGGAVSLDAALGGSLSAIEVVGKGRLEGGLLQLRGFDDRATGFDGDLVFSQNSIIVDRARGRWAGGRLLLTGRVELDRFLPEAVALRIEVDGARPRIATDSVDLSGVLTGRLEWSGPWSRSRISGDLDVERGLVSPKINWQSLASSRQVVEVYDPSAEVMDFDVGLHSRQPFRLKNDEVDVEANGDIRLTGTNERIGLLGAVSVVRGGRVIFLGREYTMESGVVEFRDRYRFTTRFDLVASARACEARISLNLVGSLDDIETVYSSTPEMDRRDIVSCLIRGVKVTELDQDLASFAGSALLKLSGVDREVKKVLPIDQLDVTTEYSSLSRQYEPRVVIGKDLSFLDRPTRLEYSTSLLRADDQRAALRMRLTPRLNLQLGWTSSEDVPYGDWGVDLRRRWEW